MKQEREFLVSDETDVAIRKARTTLKRLGELTEVEPGQTVVGRVIALGSRHVTVRIHWKPENADAPAGKGGVATVPSIALGTILLLEAECAEDPSGRAAINVLDRFEDAYRQFTNPDYKPDRAGMLPATIIGIVVAVLLMLVFFMRSPMYKKFFPKMPANYLKDAKEQKQEEDAEKQRKEEMGENDKDKDNDGVGGSAQ